MTDQSCVEYAERVLFASSHVFRVRCFSLNRKEFVNVIQFIPGTASSGCLCGQSCVVAAGSLIVTGLLGSLRRSIQTSESSRVDLESGFKFSLRFFRFSRCEQQIAE